MRPAKTKGAIMKVLRSIGLPVALLCLTHSPKSHHACLLAQAPLTSPIQEDPSTVDSSSPRAATKASASVSPQTLARVRALDAEASQLKARGKYEEAESLYRQSLALNEASSWSRPFGGGGELEQSGCSCVRRAATMTRPNDYFRGP